MPKSLKQHALEALKSSWLIAVVAVFVTSLIPEILTVIYDFLNLETSQQFNDALLELQENPSYLASPDLMLAEMIALFESYNASLKFGWLTWIASFVPFLFELALAGGFIAIVRNKKALPRDFLSKMKLVGTSVLMAFIQSVAIGLGFVLFIFPGIYLLFAYSMVFYLKIDNPDMSIRKCFKTSRELMRGKKLLLFNHFMSFIGWYILAGVASMLVTELLSGLKIGLVGDILIAVFSTAFTAVVTAYWLTARALFYEFNFVRPPVTQTVYVHVTPDPFAEPADPFSSKSNDPFEQNDAQNAQQSDPFNAPNSNDPFEF